MEVVFIGILGLGLYFIPSIVGRKAKNSGSIFLVNLLFGWSLIGWVVALIWATSGKKEGVTYKCTKCGLATELPNAVTMFICPNCGQNFQIQ